MKSERSRYLAVGALYVAAMVVVSIIEPSPFVLLGVAFMPLAIWIVLEAPIIPTIAFVLLAGARLNDAIPGAGSAPLALLAGSLAVVALVWHVGARNTRPAEFPPELKWFSLYVLFLAASLVTSMHRSVTFSLLFEGWSRLAVGFVLLLWLVRSFQELRLVTVGLVVAGTTTSTIAIYHAMRGTSMMQGERLILSGNFADPNDLSLGLLPALGLAAAFAIHRSGALMRLLGGVTVALIIAAISYTLSRGGLLGAVTVLTVISYLTGRLKGLIILGVLGTPVIALLLARLALRGDLAETEDGIEYSSHDRLQAWKAAIRMGLSRPFGVGLGNFEDAILIYADQWDNFRAMATHNTWLQVFGEAGVPAFVCLIMLVVTAFRSLTVSRSLLEKANPPSYQIAMANGMIAGLAGYCVSASFLSQAMGWMLYLLIALSAVLRRCAEAQYGAAASQVAQQGREGPSPEPARS